MTRYLYILLAIAVLAAAYAALGGFESTEALPESAESGAASTEAHAIQTRIPLDPESVDPQIAEFEAAGTPLHLESALEAPEFHSTFESVDAEGPASLLANGDWQQATIGPGQSFYVALSRFGLAHEDIMNLVKACKPHTDLRRVQRGDTFDIRRDDSGRVTDFLFELDAEHFLMSTRIEDGFNTEIGSYELERTLKGVRGTISSSLFESLKDQGADPTLAVQLSEILGWDIDFFRDLRKGDSFVLLYEEISREGKRVRDGRILAAHFTNQGREHEAYLHENKLGFPAYYDEEGNSLEKQFLRAPLKFSRISSGFSRRRLHPVLKRYRPHYGVDYAAPSGTPIYATASGVVVHREKKGGNGRYVTLRHGNSYETWYLHMSRHVSGMKVGDKIQQGDVIGYVGQTGLATAPHCCYRVKKNGKWVNSRKLDLPPAQPIEADRRAEYELVRDDLREQIVGIPPEEAKTVVLRSQITRGEPGPSGR